MVTTTLSSRSTHTVLSRTASLQGSAPLPQYHIYGALHNRMHVQTGRLWRQGKGQGRSGHVVDARNTRLVASSVT